MIELTRAYIFDAQTMPSVISQIIYPIKEQPSPYYLLVVSKIQEKVKFSVYPVENECILKVILNGISLGTLTINLFPKPLINNIIHSTGIIKIKSILVYEFYIAVNYENRNEISNYLRKIRSLDGINSVQENWIRVDKIN